MLKRHCAGAARVRLLPAAACLLLPTLLHAAEPTGAAAAAPQTPPFDRYQAWRDGELADWRAANARVGAVGGWRTYLRETTAPEAEADGDGEDAAHGGHRGAHDAD